MKHRQGKVEQMKFRICNRGISRDPNLSLLLKVVLREQSPRNSVQLLRKIPSSSYDQMLRKHLTLSLMSRNNLLHCKDGVSKGITK